MNYRAGRLEETPPESREVFANGISVCLAGQQLWITDETSGASADIRAGCARLPPEVNRAFDIGGRDMLTYAEMMPKVRCSGRPVAGLWPRLPLPVGVLSPSLSSHWVGLVIPVPGALACPLVESLRHDAVAAEHGIARYVPDPPGGLTGFDGSARLALQKVRDADIATRWSWASLPGAPSDPLPADPDWAGGSLYHDLREKPVKAPGEAVWRVIEGIGGEHGWYSWPLVWAVRGCLDRAAGGAELRRGHAIRTICGQATRSTSGG